MTECYFCGATEEIETHHIVPQRFDGSDKESNVVDLCHDCHWKLERLYNKDFWEAIGIEDPRATQETHLRCGYQGCMNQAAEKHYHRGEYKYRCESHPPKRTDEMGTIKWWVDEQFPTNETVIKREIEGEFDKIDISILYRKGVRKIAYEHTEKSFALILSTELGDYRAKLDGEEWQFEIVQPG